MVRLGIFRKYIYLILKDLIYLKNINYTQFVFLTFNTSINYTVYNRGNQTMDHEPHETLTIDLSSSCLSVKSKTILLI